MRADHPVHPVRFPQRRGQIAVELTGHGVAEHPEPRVPPQVPHVERRQRRMAGRGAHRFEDVAARNEFTKPFATHRDVAADEADLAAERIGPLVPLGVKQRRRDHALPANVRQEDVAPAQGHLDHAHPQPVAHRFGGREIGELQHLAAQFRGEPAREGGGQRRRIAFCERHRREGAERIVFDHEGHAAGLPREERGEHEHHGKGRGQQCRHRQHGAEADPSPRRAAAIPAFSCPPPIQSRGGFGRR